MKFIVILQFFLLIIMVVWNIKQTIMKDYNVQSCQSWLTIAFASPHKITIMWFMLKIFIYNLLWLAEYQFKGVVKFNLSDLFFWGQFWRSWKRLNWKNLLLTLIAVTRIINLDRCILKSNVLNFQYSYLISDPHYFLKSKSLLISLL